MTAVDLAPAEAPTSSEPGRYEAFLSYAREDSGFVVNRLRANLAARGQAAWVDVDITGGAQWRGRVKRGIEACKALIFVVSPDSVASEACRHELADAVALNKLIIPVIYRDVPEDVMPPALRDVEWVFLRECDDPVAGLDRLVEALETDLEWRDQHTRLAGRAREWLDSGRDSSYTLRGEDLREAEAWLVRQAGHRQAPTREQAQYISFSRQAASRRLYALVAALAAGLAVAIALAVIALVQRASANREAHVAQSQLLASQAVDTTDPELARLLAVGAYEISPTIDAKSAILTVADTGEQGILSTGNAGVYATLSAPVTAVALIPKGPSPPRRPTVPCKSGSSPHTAGCIHSPARIRQLFSVRR